MSLNHKNKNIVMKRYDSTYLSYDELYGEEQFKKYENSFLKISDKIARRNVVSIFDIGCGTGLLLKFIEEKRLVDKYRKFYYIGIDLSINSIRLAEKKRGNFITDFIIGDAEDPPIRLDAIDVAISYTVIHHFNNPFKFIYTLLNRVKRELIISILKRDEASQVVDRIDSIKKLIERDFTYTKIIEEKDIIIIFELDGKLAS